MSDELDQGLKSVARTLRDIRERGLAMGRQQDVALIDAALATIDRLTDGPPQAEAATSAR
jgi:hypothetical protein